MDELTLSRVNLLGVLRTLEQLPALDPESKKVIEDRHEIIQFASPKTKVRLAINDGVITHHEGGGPATIKLAFPTSKMVNKMFAGTGNPIPTKGFTKIDFLKGPFTKLTDRLTYFLLPTPELLQDAEYARTNAVLTLHLAVYALAEIGNSDEIGRYSMLRVPEGDLQIAVKDGPSLIVRKRQDRLRIVQGISEQPRAKMVFEDIDSAGQVLRNELSSYTAIGRGLIQLSGYVHMLDNVNKLLSLVPRYLG